MGPLMQKTPYPPVRRWQLPLLGLHEFPDGLTDFEIGHFFSFEPEVKRAIMSRRSPAHRLAVAVHIGFVRMTGRSLDAFDALPAPVVAQLKQELQIPTPDLASVRVLYERRRTLFDHQRFAAEVANFRPLNDRRKRVLLTQLRAAAKTTLSTDRLLQHARRWLYDTRILIPAERTLRAVARRAESDCERAMLDLIGDTIPATVRSSWLAELLREHPPCETTLDWVQRPPGKRSKKALDQVMAKIGFLHQLGVDQYSLGGISLEQQRAYARRVRRRRPAKWRRVKEPRRTLELVCFVRISLMQLTDVFLSMASMQGAAIFRKATEEVLAQRLPDEGAAKRLREVSRLADDFTLNEAQLRERLRELAPADLVRGRIAAQTRERLSRNARKTRPLLKRMLEIDLESAADAPLKAAVDVLRSSYNEGRTTLPCDVDAAFAPRWRELIESSDRRQAMRGFEAATLQQLRRALRNGTVWVSDSLKYRNRDDILLSEADWRRTRARHFRRMKIPFNVKRHLAPLLCGLEAGLAALAEAVGERVVRIEDRKLHLKALIKQTTPDSVEEVRRVLFRDIGAVQLSELIVEMDSRIRFSWELLGRPPRSGDELLAMYAGLLAHATGSAASDTALMVPRVKAPTIAAAMQHLQDEGVLAGANALATEFLQSQPLVQVWGAGTTASSDSMSLEAPRQLWNARVDPRHRRHAIGMYTHVLDQWGIIYDQPLVLGERQAGAAIEGMMRQTASVDLEQLAVDTHGYTDFAMSLSKLLGFDLCPRLRDLKLRRLHLPRSIAVPEVLAPIVDCDVNLDVIAKGWDGLVRIAASIESGCTPATLALERFGSAARGDPIYEAGVALGKLRRSLFLADFCANGVFRRELLRVLTYGESVHALQRAIHPGRIGVSRGRRPDELAAISGSLALIANLVMAWTAHRMQRVLDQWRSAGIARPDDAILRHIAPVHFGGINFRGVFHFPVGRHANRLLVRSA
jgi:TnpA family transposase